MWDDDGLNAARQLRSEVIRVHHLAARFQVLETGRISRWRQLEIPGSSVQTLTKRSSVPCRRLPTAKEMLTSHAALLSHRDCRYR